MKKILILGAGNAQIDAIEYCKNQGYIVYGCSYTNTDKGIPLLDYFKQIDIKNVDGIAEYVKENQIDVVYSVGSDLAMPTVMKVSEKLGLRHFISSKTAEICQAKHLMRESLGNDFIGNVPYIVCSHVRETDSYADFPGMMKPVDSQGQRGCYRVDSLEDIRNNFDKSQGFSKSGKVIIEKYVEGPEISVNVFIVNGKIMFSIISDRIVFSELPGGIIKEHLLPTQYKESEAEVNSLAQRIVEQLEIKDGPVYMQIKLDSGHPVILEVTPRLDGCHMWNLIKHYCNVDLLDATFKYLLEQEVVEFNLKKNDAKMKLQFMCEKPNKKFVREKYDCNDSEYCCWYYENGDNVKSLNGYMEKCGYQIMRY